MAKTAADTATAEDYGRTILDIFRRFGVGANGSFVVKKLRAHWLGKVDRNADHLNEGLRWVIAQGYLTGAESLFSLTLTESGFTEIQRIASK